MAKKPSPRVTAASIASVLLILLLNTCGIEQYIQLNPPTNPGKLGDTFRIIKTLDNSETAFIGFDLYYKFFNAGAVPDLTYIIQFEDLISGTHPFRRIHASDDDEGTPLPLMYVQPEDRTPGGSPPDNDEFMLAIRFDPTDLLDPFPKIEGDGTANVDFSGLEHTDIRRDVFDGSEYKAFSDFSSSDADIIHLSDDIIGGASVQLVLYAVSYGYDTDNFRPLRSEPVHLGTIERTFP